MREFKQPVIVVSKCLEFAPCRYNGDVIHEPIIANLAPYVTFIPICPEVEIGLGTPRETIRIVSINGGAKQLVQPSTKAEVTEEMKRFAESFLQMLPEIDGFILKSRSPSCGVKDVKVYSGYEKAPVIETGSGLFGGKVLEKYGHAAIEDEGRLRNFTIREHFFAKLFTLRDFRDVKSISAMEALIDFHSKNKYLLMSYHQGMLKKMGRVVANHDKLPWNEVISQYELLLSQALLRLPRNSNNVNVCQHIFGYFSSVLTIKEKEYFLSLLDRFHQKKVPLSVCTSMLRSWAIRFEQQYLLEQTYFDPYPEDLLEISDSGKGRDY